MKNVYSPLDIVIIRLEDCDCICTSGFNPEDYDDNEMPLVPFE